MSGNVLQARDPLGLDAVTDYLDRYSELLTSGDLETRGLAPILFMRDSDFTPFREGYHPQPTVPGGGITVGYGYDAHRDPIDIRRELGRVGASAELIELLVRGSDLVNDDARAFLRQQPHPLPILTQTQALLLWKFKGPGYAREARDRLTGQRGLVHPTNPLSIREYKDLHPFVQTVLTDFAYKGLIGSTNVDPIRDALVGSPDQMLGNLRALVVANPGWWQAQSGVARTLGFIDSRRLALRAESEFDALIHELAAGGIRVEGESPAPE